MLPRGFHTLLIVNLLIAPCAALPELDIDSAHPTRSKLQNMTNPGRVMLSHASRAPGRLWRKYLHHLDRSPILTKTCTSVLATVVGDMLAQQASKPRGSKDWK